MFRKLLAEHPEFKAEHFFSAVQFLLCERWPNPDDWASIDSDTACDILETKLPRFMEFSRVADGIPQDKIGAAWTIYEGASLPDSFFTSSSFMTALDALAALRKGVQPRNVN